MCIRDRAAALFGENKLFLAEKKAQETAGLYKSCGAYEPVSYTHLDVYKRQLDHWLLNQILS